jgi:hypothetical protein
VLLVSDDDGAHWKERPLPFTSDDRGVYIAAVDPKSAARIYVRTSGVDASHLLVSDDGGKALREVIRGGPMQGFALADDGATIYVGGPKDGLLRASASDLRFEKRTPTPIQCLTSVGATLWACAPMTAGFVLGASDDHGATFAPKLTLAGMRGPLQCTAPSAMDQCTADWTALRALVGGGRPASAASAAPAAPPGKPTACGCAIPTSSQENRAVLAAFFLAALGVVRRRRRAS